MYTLQICIALHRIEALMYRSHSTAIHTHHTDLHLVSVHQTAPPLTSNSSHVIAAFYSFIDPATEGKGKAYLYIAPFVKLQLRALRYGSHGVAPANYTNYTISASTLRTFAR